LRGRILSLLAVVMVLVLAGSGVSLAVVLRPDPGDSNIRGTEAPKVLETGPNRRKRDP
jgi:hypothetical protein